MRTFCVALLLALAVFGCKKTNQSPTQPPQPVALPLGAPAGTATTKTIGPGGGNLQTPDGALQLIIPPGALTGTTEISIQPVTRTLASTTGTVYRLLPENVQFQKDVTINFSYTADDLKGTSDDLLYLAYQDAAGYWRRVVRTGIDKQQKRLTAQTRHFSDWAVERVFYIAAAPTPTVLSAGQEAQLKVYYDDLSPNAAGIDDLLTPVQEIPEEKVEGWFINGPGTLTETKKPVTRYQAPASIIEPQTIAVGVRVKGLVSKTHPERPGTGGLVIIQQPVDLVPDEYFTWEIGGSTNTAVALDGALLGGTTNIIGTGLTGGVALTLNAMKPGNYDLGNAAAADMFNLQVSRSQQSSVIYLGTYYNCNDSTPRYGKGKLVITSFGSIGGFIEGTFTATVYDSGSACNSDSRQVSGKFKVRRKA